jgi:O-antigen/teichoic acid export membrane protein
MKDNVAVPKRMGVPGGLLVRNTLLSLLAQAAPLVVTLVAIPYIVRGLGKDRFGVLSLAWLIAGYFVLFELGLGKAMTKFVAEALGKGETETIAKLFWTTLGLHVVAGMAGGFALVAASPLLVGRVLNIPPALVPETRTTLLIVALSVPLTMALGALGGLLQAAQRFDLLTAIQLPSIALGYLIPALGVALHLRLPGIVAIMVVSKLATALVYLWLCVKVYPQLRCVSIDSRRVASLVAFGSWVTVCNLVIPILTSLDRFLIGSLLSMTAVTYYTVPFTAVLKLNLLPGSITTVTFPAFSAMASVQKEALQQVYARTLKYLLLIMGPAVLTIILFSRDLLGLWMGSDFAAKDSLVLQILAGGVLLNGLSQIPASLLDGLGRPDLRAKLFLACAPIYVGALWLLIVKMGITGAALAWTLRAGLELILFFGLTYRLMHMRPAVIAENGVMKSLVTVTGLGVVMAAVVEKTLVAKGAVVILALTLFSVIAWRYLLDKVEKTTLKEMLLRVPIVGGLAGAE